ncbi:MAG: adenine phosphoribosyltransferase [Clostridia bacterium]|nr:adenine phosphoribosyltransferase [Clostridia bacterium]
MKKTYRINIEGIERDLRLYPIAPDKQIAAFILFSDVEMVQACAKGLLEKAPDFDVILTPEAKSISLAYEMSRLSGKQHVIARKGLKVYIENPISSTLSSITTTHNQAIYLGDVEVEMLKGKRVLVIDDVISTGASLEGIENLLSQIDCTIAGEGAVLAEADAAKRDDIFFLQTLPLFDGEGNPLPLD